ncbi:MAG: SRPBCC family protein [Nitratireductor sp.]|nr:SRPBCC family protein [Nitratireductor sp.]
MSIVEESEAYGEMIEPATLRIERTLPGPIERVWAYLTESDKRRLWLASGDMDLREDGDFELVWRNDELTDPPGQRPEGFGEEHSMQGKILEVEPMRLLRFSWGEGDVTFTLEPKGNDICLMIVHRRITDPAMRVMIGAGWHAHLAVLKARLENRPTAGGFWDMWLRLKQDYETRI